MRESLQLTDLSYTWRRQKSLAGTWQMYCGSGSVSQVPFKVKSWSRIQIRIEPQHWNKERKVAKFII